MKKLKLPEYRSPRQSHNPRESRASSPPESSEHTGERWAGRDRNQPRKKRQQVE